MHYNAKLSNGIDEHEIEVQARNREVLIDKLELLMEELDCNVADAWYAEESKYKGKYVLHYEL
jgi:hypothetical protein|nr:MAG TPA: hypothetical protein [Caudoviricetes sp.]